MMRLKRKKKLYGKFNVYVFQVFVLGFNLVKYDLNLIKMKLVKYLGFYQEEYCFIIKKNNVYVCILIEKLKFLDVFYFLVFGMFYVKFLIVY